MSECELQELKSIVMLFDERCPTEKDSMPENTPDIAATIYNGNRPLSLDRDRLGRIVREAWVKWAQTQPNPKPSWLVPYDELSEPDKEADRQIGETVARWTIIADACSAGSPANDIPSSDIAATLAELDRLLKAARKDDATWEEWDEAMHSIAAEYPALRAHIATLTAEIAALKANAAKPAIDVACPYHGCDGEIMFADIGEVYDGEEGNCDTCGRLAVAVAYVGGTMGCQTREEPNEDD